MYFARRQEGDKSEMPLFAGQRGPEILRGLIEIEAVFDKNLSMLFEVKKTILDVKATTWHDDYNRLIIILLIIITIFIERTNSSKLESEALV